ncbi:uncharacterized protein LOC121429308 [Lytechinus variegatus]|uniref:uncharacterized protein LOC121429308 n=1 Tax=Lytechinus variegatus TaxID=7654 RepID=UPI001BB0E98B|nr:uncharacterized protein LOC121429308 [Lytechinus variegatus]
MRINFNTTWDHPGPGPGGKMPYKRPPAPLPRESTKRKPYYDEPEYAEIDQIYKGSPRKKQREKDKYVKFTKNQYQDSADEGDVKPTRKRAQEKVENDYIDILADDDVDNAYLTPTLRGERYESAFDSTPIRPR